MAPAFHRWSFEGTALFLLFWRFTQPMFTIVVQGNPFAFDVKLTTLSASVQLADLGRLHFAKGKSRDDFLIQVFYTGAQLK
jgi:hypothetical protein